MICKHCKNKLNTTNCSEREGLLFYCICSNCKVVSRVDIDLETNKITSSVASDNEFEKVKELFDKKKKNELAKEGNKQIAEANKINNALNMEHMVEDFIF